jgi:hypothetical protein
MNKPLNILTDMLGEKFGEIWRDMAKFIPPYPPRKKLRALGRAQSFSRKSLR